MSRIVLFCALLLCLWACRETPETAPPPHLEIKAFALHELGHAQSLEHSPDPTSIMYVPIANGKRISFNDALEAESVNLDWPLCFNLSTLSTHFAGDVAWAMDDWNEWENEERFTISPACSNRVILGTIPAGCGPDACTQTFAADIVITFRADVDWF